MNITEQFLNSIEAIAENEISKSVFERSKKSLLDYIAVTIAGAKANEVKLAKYFSEIMPEPGRSVLIGLKETTNLKEAAFLNGLNSHALDFDDGTNAGIIHLGSPIFSVLIPLAEKYQITIKKMLTAAIIGYETSFTMAMSIQPKHKAMGYHATGTCGVLGIAIAVSYMLDFSPEERRNAFAIAAVSATGMLKVLDDESELKPYNVAKTSLLGLTATQMAKVGFVGHHDPLGGDRGFIKMMTGIENVELCEPLLNGTYAIEKTYTKPYAACRYCHPAIEGAINLGRKIDVENIKKITVETYDLAVRGHEHTAVMGVNSAKMSIPYGVAVGVLKGKAGLLEYNEKTIKDINVVNLAKKVIVISNEEYSRQFPGKQTGYVSITMNDGNQIDECVEFPKGEPENPLSDTEFTERFLDMLEFGTYSKEEGKKIIQACNDENTIVNSLCKII